jgi:hypothetical protein
MKGKNFMSRKVLNPKNVSSIEISEVVLRAKLERTET